MYDDGQSCRGGSCCVDGIFLEVKVLALKPLETNGVNNGAAQGYTMTCGGIPAFEANAVHVEAAC
jgi:hypothetical protein